MSGKYEELLDNFHENPRVIPKVGGQMIWILLVSVKWAVINLEFVGLARMYGLVAGPIRGSVLGIRPCWARLILLALSRSAILGGP